MSIKVDFPAPDGPIIAVSSPDLKLPLIALNNFLLSTNKKKIFTKSARLISPFSYSGANYEIKIHEKNWSEKQHFSYQLLRY